MDTAGSPEQEGHRAIIDAKTFAWLMISVLAGCHYGVVVRATGHEALAATIAGVVGGVAVLRWLSSFDWCAIFTTGRGWIMIGASAAVGIVAGFLPIYVVGERDLLVRAMAVLAAASIGFGATLRTADYFVKRS